MRDGRPTGLPKGPFGTCYSEIRILINQVEQMMDTSVMTPKQLKRLDKAVFMMKIGAKMMKKAIRAPKQTNVVPIRAANS